jgi:hypothetical protein
MNRLRPVCEAAALPNFAAIHAISRIGTGLAVCSLLPASVPGKQLPLNSIFHHKMMITDDC